MKKPAEPLRGDAAYRAMKGEIAKRNDAAQRRAAVARAARDARRSADVRADLRRENADLPTQPGR